MQGVPWCMLIQMSPGLLLWNFSKSFKLCKTAKILDKKYINVKV